MNKNQQDNKNVRVKSPQVKAHWLGIKKAIIAARELPHNLALAPPRYAPPPELSPAQLQAQLVTPAQSEALAKMQAACVQAAALVRDVNTMAVVFGLDMPRIYAPEVAERLMAIDVRIKQAGTAARRLGVTPVVAQAKLAPLPPVAKQRLDV